MLAVSSRDGASDSQNVTPVPSLQLRNHNPGRPATRVTMVSWVCGPDHGTFSAPRQTLFAGGIDFESIGPISPDPIRLSSLQQASV